MRAHFFSQFDYADMVAAQYQLVTKGLSVNHLRLVLGTSMGCMHTWMWGENYPDLMDALMPIACLPVAVAGRNHVFRQMITDAIRQDPDWKHGDYTDEPRDALRAVRSIELIAGSSPLDLQKNTQPRMLPRRAWMNSTVAIWEGLMRTISCFNGAHRRIMIHPRCSVRSPLQ